MLSNKKLNPIVTELFIRGKNYTFYNKRNTILTERQQKYQHYLWKI